ncbi:aspartyl-phosphate phosphatase Spo0E family protein [Aneurinibacillus tyrosinisolvens]|uniref:aspartyl-phosphate phosphatase Spo0E family protein n=1 Tax=Aneurinibacillus tyrosinisolvens TaxID=1443435 RepID=UPI00063FB21E|nr:aspartyl-phosphate phosphatase Spo0E family protein [Aneurinibacillus tyrosinisolvens]
MEHIINKIEELRKEMIETARGKSLTHPDVCKVSRHLDFYINEYIKMTNAADHSSSFFKECM